MKRINSLNEILDCGQNFYIYGTGFRAKLLYRFLIRNGRKVRGFLTTGKEKRESLYHRPVRQIWDIADENEGPGKNPVYDKDGGVKIILAVQERFWDEITRLLDVLRIPTGNQYCMDYAGMLSVNESEIDRILACTEVYGYLQDWQSRLIFRSGVMYRLTNDYSYFLKRTESFYQPESILKKDRLISLADWIAGQHYLDPQKKIALYAPAGIWIGFSYPRLKEMGIRIDCICTNQEDLQRKVFYGIPAVSLEDGAKYIGDGYLLIGSGMKQFTDEVQKLIVESGFHRESIVAPCSQGQPFSYGMQYFDLRELQCQEDEVYIDAGCLDCSTVLDFLQWNRGKYKHIYAFEPDQRSYDCCRKVILEKQIDRITLIPKGLWSQEQKIGFNSDRNLALSKITENGENMIETVSLDDFLKGDRASFIKMDIEGAELDALRGAEQTIKTFKPRLAVSVYHKVNDFIDIPEYLLSLVPEYKFYIRHYSVYKYETVLYALI